MARTSVDDPLKVFRFLVDVPNMARAGFMECSGLKRTTETSKYREGGDSETTKKSAGLTDFAPIVLKRGQILDEGQNDLYNWAQEVHNVTSLIGAARDYRRDVDVIQYERGGLEAIRWRVYEAFPSDYKATGDLSGLSSDNSIEEMTLEHEGYEKVL